MGDAQGSHWSCTRNGGQCGGVIKPFISTTLLEDEVKAWCEKANESLTKEGVIQDHVAFEHIHPFRDGNGRIGRMIMNWQLIGIGSKPIIITPFMETKGIYVSQEDYYEWF